MANGQSGPNTPRSSCPCGSCGHFDDCCGRYLDQKDRAPTPEALMRSRYTAYALRQEAYLLRTWHPATRPAALNLDDAATTKWIGLEIKQHQVIDPQRATVEFVARYKINGRAHRLHEVSRFYFEDGQWFYVDGDIVSPRG